MTKIVAQYNAKIFPSEILPYKKLRKIAENSRNTPRTAIRLLDDNIEKTINTLLDLLDDGDKKIRLKAAEILLKKTLPDRKEITIPEPITVKLPDFMVSDGMVTI